MCFQTVFHFSDLWGVTSSAPAVTRHNFFLTGKKEGKAQRKTGGVSSEHKKSLTYCSSSCLERRDLKKELRNGVGFHVGNLLCHLVCRVQTAWSTYLQRRERASCIWRKQSKLWRCRRTAVYPTTKKTWGKKSCVKREWKVGTFHAIFCLVSVGCMLECMCNILGMSQ